MLVRFDGFAGMQRCAVYLEDDRIEVGRTGIAYLEDLSRVAYRDVHAVSFTAGWHGVRLFVAGFFALIAVVLGLSALGESDPSGLLGASAVGLVVATGLAWWGWKGAVLRFRVDGIRGSVTGGVAARRAKRERFRALLLERIQQAKERALQGPESPRPPSA